jgi:CheY-like chemotaxis protein
MYNSKPVLLAEDDDADALMTKRALNELKVTNRLVRKVDGEDALEYLTDQSNEKPSIILLDLNMPRMNGFEFLKIIKADPMLKMIPVVVVTTSDADHNIMESYNLGAAGYIVKPFDYNRFVAAMRTIDMYWTLNRLPDGSFETSTSQVFDEPSATIEQE